MKAVVINPYMTVVMRLAGLKKFRAWIPPLGLGYLKSFVENNSNHEVQILDCIGQAGGKVSLINGNYRIGMTDAEIKESLLRISPDVVGISACFTPNYDDAFRIAELAKEILPRAKIVLGGSHATIDYQNVINDQPVDIVVRGDGEETFLDLLNNMEKGDYVNTRGTVVKTASGVVTNETRLPIQDLDSVPFPSYDGMNIDYYLGYDEKSRIRKFLSEPIGSIMSSRGCHYNCIFCATDKVFKKFRGRTPKNVVSEIEYLVNKYGVKEIVFHDDCFLASKDRVRGVCDEILKRGIKIRWHAGPGMSVWLLDEELLTIMNRSGLYRIALTIESGCEETLKFIRKKINLDKAREIINICNRLGIRVSANFIIGFPHETKEHIDKTRDYIMNADLDTVSILLSQPLKGAELYEVYENEGLMPAEGPLLNSSIFRTRYNSKYFTADELNGAAEAMRRDFRKKLFRKMITPNGFYYHVVTKLNSPEKIKYTLKKLLLRFIDK